MTTANPRTLPVRLDADTLTAWLTDKISEILGVDADDIDVNDKLTDYGMDSRQFVDLRFDLEELLGHELPSTLMWEDPSIVSIAEMLTAGQIDSVRSKSSAGGQR
jgi:acyl carrier protein